MDTHPKAAAIYCRISQDREGEGLGVERQRQDCLALADRRGWTVVRTFIDNDFSAYSGKPRPAYKEMLAAVRARQIDGLIVYDLDRLHRSPRELELFFDVVDSVGLSDLATVSGDVNLGTEDGRFHARIMGAVAKKESADKSRRIKRKHQERAEAGKPIVGGTRPFGLTADWTALVPEEAALIREAAQRVLAGASIRGIASDWGERGIVTTVGGRWQQGPLRRMLTQARLAGRRELVRKDKSGAMTTVATGHGTWPAIIDEATLHRLRVILRDPSRRTARVNARSYLLSGFLICSLCGKQMRARPRVDKVRRYVCASGPMFQGCGKTATVADPVEDLVSSWVLERLSSKSMEVALAAAPDDDRGGEALALAADRASLVELSGDYYQRQLIGKDEFITNRNALQASIERRQAVIAAREGSLAMSRLLTGSVRESWMTADLDRRRAVLSAVIGQIVINPAVKGRNRFDPSRVEVDWRA